MRRTSIRMVWYEYKGKAYAVRRELLTVIKVEKQKIYDEIYEDLNDLISRDLSH